MKLKDNYLKWKKEKIEKAYKKYFPESKPLIIEERVDPVVLHTMQVVLENSSYEKYKEELAKHLGLCLLEQDLIKFDTLDSLDDPNYTKRIVATVIALQPSKFKG